MNVLVDVILNRDKSLSKTIISIPWREVSRNLPDIISVIKTLRFIYRPAKIYISGHKLIVEFNNV